jgi:hypothetical protein
VRLGRVDDEHARHLPAAFVDGHLEQHPALFLPPPRAEAIGDARDPLRDVAEPRARGGLGRRGEAIAVIGRNGPGLEQEAADEIVEIGVGVGVRLQELDGAHHVHRTSPADHQRPSPERLSPRARAATHVAGGQDGEPQPRRHPRRVDHARLDDVAVRAVKRAILFAVRAPVEAGRHEARHALAFARDRGEKIGPVRLFVDDHGVARAAQHLDVRRQVLQLHCHHLLIDLGRAAEAEEEQKCLPVADAGRERRVDGARGRIVGAAADAPHVGGDPALAAPARRRGRGRGDRGFDDRGRRGGLIGRAVAQEPLAT